MGSVIMQTATKQKELDKDWVKSSFMITGAENLDTVDQKLRFFSTASMKFSDTTPGGSFAINPPPQFTRSADPKADSLFRNGTDIEISNKNEGRSPFTLNPHSNMGRYYSEAIDDNAQLIHMRFGVPKFNSLVTFFTSFYNSGAGRMARTGRFNAMLYGIGRVVGLAMQLYAPPLLYLQVANFVGTGIRFMMGKPSSKFYYLKPTMPLYWNAVTTIVNHLAVLKNIVPRVGDPKMDDNYRLGQSETDAERKYYASLMPDVFYEDGTVNVYALATRAQRKYRRFRKAVEENIDKRFDSVEGISAAIKSFTSQPLTDNSRTGRLTIQQYIQDWMKNSEGVPVTSNSSDAAQSSDPNKTTEAVEKVPDKVPAEDGFWNFLASELDDGSAFVTFRVNHTGTIQESFSNSVGESDIVGTINGMSSKARSTNFSLANGNIAGVFGDIIQGVKDVAAGIGDQLGISGIATAVTGGAFVDIPKHWQSSSANLPRSTYTIQLLSPYGNNLSRFLNIDIPLAMLLAGALPLSTGKQSYTSPFLCELYDQGRCQTRLGMIDSLSITRGTGNLGWNNSGQTMAVEVSFSVIDMSSILHMPIMEGFSLDPATALFDEDTAFSDYMASLAGLGLSDQIYPWRKLKINLTKQREHWDTFWSKSHAANWFGGTTVMQLVSGLYKGTVR